MRRQAVRYRSPKWKNALHRGDDRRMVGAGCFESGRDLWLPQRGGGLRVARKIATKITQRTRILSDNSLVGQREELLKDLSVEFRYLVEGNYKILYYTLPEKVVISLVFDCRQNSEKDAGYKITT